MFALGSFALNIPWVARQATIVWSENIVSDCRSSCRGCAALALGFKSKNEHKIGFLISNDLVIFIKNCLLKTNEMLVNNNDFFNYLIEAVVRFERIFTSRKL